jgi:hypothetical protein
MTFYSRPFGDGRDIEVVSLTYARARIIVTDGYTVDDQW